jgi:DNA repair protein RecO (recombination protein O)
MRAMEWTDEAIILSTRPHGETSAVVEVLTRAHGRWRGLVRGARSRRSRPFIQPGRVVQASWRARLADQLGHMRLEPLAHEPLPPLADGLALAGLSLLTFDLHLLPEREPARPLHDAARIILGHLSGLETWPALLARLELRLLADLGYGLDLSACALGGSGPLAWVSPKTGRAASLEAGRPWADRLLPLPAFLLENDADGAAGRGGASSSMPGCALPGPAEMADALRLTGHFIARRILHPRRLDMPPERRRIIEALRAAGS